MCVCVSTFVSKPCVEKACPMAANHFKIWYDFSIQPLSFWWPKTHTHTSIRIVNIKKTNQLNATRFRCARVFAFVGISNIWRQITHIPPSLKKMYALRSSFLSRFTIRWWSTHTKISNKMLLYFWFLFSFLMQSLRCLYLSLRLIPPSKLFHVYFFRLRRIDCMRDHVCIGGHF